MKPQITILRTSKDSKGAFSVVFDGDGKEFCIAAEGISPITGQLVLQPGRYVAQKDFYNHGNYATFEIIVWGHDRILFHKGNFKRDSKACVILAEKFADIDGEAGIGESKEAFEEFWKKYEQFDQIEVEVIDASHLVSRS
jgi:hypothetical protein